MVARLSEFSAPWADNFAPDLDSSRGNVGTLLPPLALRGRLLLERASTLTGVQAGGRNIPGIAGTPLHLVGEECRKSRNTFMRDRVFAAIGDDGSMCLRLPEDLADDLVENGLCVRLGKNLLTWKIENEYQLEVNWRILLHAYWNVTGPSPKQARRLLSEWVIQH